MQRQRQRIFSLLATATLAASNLVGASATATAAPATTTAHGPRGQTLVAYIAKGASIADGTSVKVRGRGYNLKVGIYLTYCVIPPKGQRPDLCGPYDVTGQNNTSFWISSNPPIYAAPLVTPFGKSGNFSKSIKVTAMIGDSDCRIVRCAITTRADHTLSNNRSADVFIPVKIK